MYKEYYGFMELPFNVTPGARFLFQTRSHLEALASMIYGIRERKGFILITGEVGTGKTTLIHTLFNYLDEKTKTAFIFHTSITFEELLNTILIELNLPIDEGGKTSHLRALSEYLIERSARGENLAVIIDEAQNLPVPVLEELRMLSNLETSTSKLLQIVLVGQPELEMKLNSENLRQLKQRIGIRRQITPLSIEEMKHYIDHRLNLVGSSSSKIFEPEAISLICGYAKGIPRVINIICDNALLIGFGLSRKKIDAGIIREVVRDMRISGLAEPAPSQPVPENKTQPRVKPPAMNPYGKAKDSNARFIVLLVIGIAFLVGLFLLANGSHFQKLRDNLTIHSNVTKLFSEVLLKVGGISLGSSNPIPTSQPPTQETGSTGVKAESPGHGFSSEARQDSGPPASRDESQVSSTGTGSVDQHASPSEPVLANTIENDSTPLLEAIPPSEKPTPGNIESSKPKNGVWKIVTVEEKECLLSLAQRYYSKGNETVVDFILQLNPEVHNVHLINHLQKIKLPEITEESLIIEQSDHTYKIHLGTFLTREPAKRYKEEPSLKGKEVEAVPKKVAPEETWYQVRAGRFKDKDECLRIIRSLKEKALLPIFVAEKSL